MILGFLVVIVVLVGCSSAFILSGRNLKEDPNEQRYVQVKPGADARSIGKELEALGVIENYYIFLFHVKMDGQGEQFKTGTYAFHQGMNYRDVIQKLVSGETGQIRFTIPEGFGVKDIAKRLSEEGIVDEQEFLEKAKQYTPFSYIRKQPNVRYAVEGFLFPDTYTMDAQPEPEDILKLMADEFDAKLTPAMRNRAMEQGLSIYDLITLASLVEKEAYYPEDRAIIAQVFFKRLSIGMPLQTDATLQYLMDAPKEDVSIEDTLIESPYNTYQHEGLPPGPIANPGMAAIEAVLYPADTDYLFFVADRHGHNYYSYTYEEHMQIVNEVR